MEFECTCTCEEKMIPYIYIKADDPGEGLVDQKSTIKADDPALGGSIAGEGYQDQGGLLEYMGGASYNAP